MARKRVYATALIAAFATFAMAGGIQASERAAVAVERAQTVAPVAADQAPAMSGAHPDTARHCAWLVHRTLDRCTAALKTSAERSAAKG